MSKIKIKFSIIAVISTIILFSNYTNAKNIKALLSLTSFNSPTDGPYVEASLSIAANSVQFAKNENGKFQAKVEVLMVFDQNNEIKNFTKTIQLSPELNDTSNLNFGFLLQQRFLLPNGNYKFELSMQDKNQTSKLQTYTDSVFILFPDEKLCFSQIDFIESYKPTEKPSNITKNGYDITPYIIDYYPSSIDNIKFYAEIYHSKKVFSDSCIFILKTYIETFESNQILSEFAITKRQKPQTVNVVLNEFDISNLPTGNYNLVLEARNQKNELLAIQKKFFQRKNLKIPSSTLADLTTDPAFTFCKFYTNFDTLAEYINCLYPISGETERGLAESIIAEKNITNMQIYLYNFWYQKDKLNPEQLWTKYLGEVKKVNANYGTRIRKGYLTDRGRVYLQYGPPNTITKNTTEPSSYPYEIWHYYQLNNQRNKKFVFYDTDFASNDYQLLHSDALGEVSDYNWQIKLHKRNHPSSPVEEYKYINNYGDKSMENYKNPY